MTIRPIEPGEIATFAALPGQADRNADVRDYVTQMVADSAMRPAWCFVAERGGEAAGAAALWTLPGEMVPLDVVLVEAPWHEPDLATGTHLLRKVLDIARDLGAGTIGHVLDDPPAWPQWQRFPERRVELLERLGFVRMRESLRVAWRGVRAPAVPDRLAYRTLDEVGEAAFVAAIARVSEGTLDQEIQTERGAKGADVAAGELFELLHKLEHDPAWWQLAYTPADDLVGLVMPAKAPSAAVIGYIGVVPEFRGRRYVDDLLALTTATLRNAGFDRVVADTDLRNAPMAAAFHRAGYATFGTRREYQVDLARPGTTS